MHGLDQPDPVLDAVWLDEAERRLAVHRAGAASGIPADDVFRTLQ